MQSKLRNHNFAHIHASSMLQFCTPNSFSSIAMAEADQLSNSYQGSLEDLITDDESFWSSIHCDSRSTSPHPLSSLERSSASARSPSPRPYERSANSPRVKRPMNAFMIWSQEMRKLVSSDTTPAFPSTCRVLMSLIPFSTWKRAPRQEPPQVLASGGAGIRCQTSNERHMRKRLGSSRRN